MYIIIIIFVFVIAFLIIFYTQFINKNGVWQFVEQTDDENFIITTKLYINNKLIKTSTNKAHPKYLEDVLENERLVAKKEYKVLKKYVK